MEEKKNNAKCPYCGAELYVGMSKGSGICTVCKKQFDNEKAMKLYESIHNESEKVEKSAAYGEEYLEVERILERVEFYFKRKQFEEARKELMSALKITTTDYRIYFGLVRVETKNLTDYRNTSHKEYLNKAIEVADNEEKKVIMRLYKDFYQLSNSSDEDILQYKKEENIAIKSKLEEKLKEEIPFYMKKEKMLKVNLIMMPILLLLGIGLFISGFVLPDMEGAFVELLPSIVMVMGACAIFAGYFCLRNYFIGKKEVRLFNALLDFYDVFDNFDYDEITKREILDIMKECRANFAEKGNFNHIEDGISRLVAAVINSGNQIACDFVSSNMVLSKYSEIFEA